MKAISIFISGQILANVTRADDWLQWGGPHGDFTVDASGLAEKWPAAGPKQLWKRPLGDGYSAILCKGDKLFTEYREGDQCAVVALDAKTSSTIWEYRYSAKLFPDMEEGFGRGPNATPAIIGSKIISLSIDAHIRCLDLSSGKLLWEHDLPTEYGRRKRVEEYGYSNSPLIYKNMIIVPVGGTDHAVIAFEPEKGEVVWKSAAGGISYASSTLTTLTGRDQFIYFEPEGIAALDPTTGGVLWRSPIEFDNGNHLTPIVKCDDTHLWAGSQFPTGGGRLLELSENANSIGAKQSWFDKKMRASHWTLIRLGDYIYGSIGDNNVSFLAAFEWRTGKIAWRERGYHKAQSLYADGKLIFLDEEGKLVLAKISPSGLQVLAAATVAESPSWTLPTLVSTTLFVRDRKNIMAFDLGKGSE
ncbi:MAG: PQQ-like beta-propeller repeat protein [Planctomycetes bacterium]|nr:PQQ-like beta-propeller repeat protein [Planctomycetota bacterium]